MAKDSEYTCVMVPPPRPIKLKAKRWKAIYDLVRVEGFTRDEKGNDIPNGIEFTMPIFVGTESID